MGKEVPPVRDDSSYGSRIQKLVEQDRMGGARQLIEEALRERPNDPDLLSWKEVLAPGRVFGRKPVNFEGTAEQRWIAKEAGRYKGQWVAVLGEELLAHAPTLQELSAKLKSLDPKSLPVILHLE